MRVVYIEQGAVGKNANKKTLQLHNNRGKSCTITNLKGTMQKLNMLNTSIEAIFEMGVLAGM